MDSKLNDWAAEHLLGIERGECCGAIGWGTANSDGTSDYGFTCSWCHEEYSHPGPCPAYPFPSVTLQDVMQVLGEPVENGGFGLHVFVRKDPDRELWRWTVMIGSDGRCDTDDPLATLIKMAAKQVGTQLRKGKGLQHDNLH